MIVITHKSHFFNKFIIHASTKISHSFNPNPILAILELVGTELIPILEVTLRPKCDMVSHYFLVRNCVTLKEHYSQN